MLKKVKAVIRTSFEISSIQEMPELKPNLRMTLTEMMMSWNAKNADARMALMKWIRLKIPLTFIRPPLLFLSKLIIERRPMAVKDKIYCDKIY
jgi:cytochrome c oxidase subunit IV